MIRMVAKEPGGLFRQVYGDNTLETYQHLVGGKIEAVTLFTDLVMIVNEEGRIIGLPYNLDIMGIKVFGPAVFVGVDGEDFADCPAEVEWFEEFWG